MGTILYFGDYTILPDSIMVSGVCHDEKTVS